jgi:hypothetical protein
MCDNHWRLKMNREQKRAWLGVATMTACVVGYFVLLPFFGPVVAMSAFTFYGINGFAKFIGPREPADERDKSIARRATLAGAIAFYLALIAVCMGTWFVAFAWQGREQVSVHFMATIIMFGAVVFLFVRSVAVLVLYGRHVEADNV